MSDDDVFYCFTCSSRGGRLPAPPARAGACPSSLWSLDVRACLEMVIEMVELFVQAVWDRLPRPHVAHYWLQLLAGHGGGSS